MEPEEYIRRDIFNTGVLPVTLNGVKVGEGKMIMDDLGNVTFEGAVWDFDNLPQIEGFSFGPLSVYDANEVVSSDIVAADVEILSLPLVPIPEEEGEHQAAFDEEGNRG